MARGIGKKASNFFVWIILGVLCFALAGFGITSFTGGSSLVGKVGSAEITAEDYARALEAELRAQSAQSGQNVRLTDLQAQGLDGRLRAALIAQAALLNEAQEMGVSVGDARIAGQIQTDPNFQGASGFSREAYEFVLGRQGFDPSEYEDSIREDITRAVLQISVVSGIEAPELLSDALTAREVERRDFTIARITAESLEATRDTPSAEELQAFYDDNGPRFERPEQRRITYAWITPAMIMDEVEVDEDMLRRLYEERIAEFVRPERRLVERLVFPDAAEAAAARAALDADETSFDDLISARGLGFADVDMGDVTAADLSDAAAAAVFVDGDLDVVGPVDSAFGPALFRVNAVLDATEVPFEAAREALREELAVERARREIAAERNAIEDALAGGAVIEDLANETAMELGEITYSILSEDGIAAYDNFRAAAQAAQESDFPETLELSDGGLFAMRLEEIIPPAIPPLAEIETEVSETWAARALREDLEARALEIMTEMATSGTALEALDNAALQTETAIGRRDFIPDAPFGLVEMVFDMAAPGDLTVLPGSDAALILRLDAIQPGNINDPDVARLRALIQDQVTQSFASDVFGSFGQAMEDEVGLTLNTQIINAVHANFP